jgi:ubiquitin-conjugating enzyme E2 variant
MRTCLAEGFRVTALIIVQVDPSKLPCLAQWKREYTMETVLIELRRYVNLSIGVISGIYTNDSCRYMAHPAHKKLPQPPEGSTYAL